MKHLQDKSDWLTYEFKPYWFFIIGLLSIVFKKSVALSSGQNFVAFISIAILFLSGAYILMVRSDYRMKASRK